MNYNELLDRVQNLVEQEDLNRDETLQSICNLLQKEVSHYDWVGFYFAESETQTLHLGAFAGEPTEHTKIPFGKGICGQVAVSNMNFIVPDVLAQDNYIACSTTVKSEIVIPLFVRDENVGQIDIDSHTLNAFTEEDERFLEKVNELVADFLF